MIVVANICLRYMYDIYMMFQHSKVAKGKILQIFTKTFHRTRDGYGDNVLNGSMHSMSNVLKGIGGYKVVTDHKSI